MSLHKKVDSPKRAGFLIQLFSTLYFIILENMQPILKFTAVLARRCGDKSLFLAALVLFAISLPVAADTKIAILDFEVKDLTLYPKVEEEQERAASIKPMLQEILNGKGGYIIVDIDSQTQEQADKGTGYLFDHHDVVAELGQQAGADLVLVGRVHKASFLFAYFLAHLVDVKSQKLVGDYVVEVKGSQKKFTTKGLEVLAEQIDRRSED